MPILQRTTKSQADLLEAVVPRFKRYRIRISMCCTRPNCAFKRFTEGDQSKVLYVGNLHFPQIVEGFHNKLNTLLKQQVFFATKSLSVLKLHAFISSVLTILSGF